MELNNPENLINNFGPWNTKETYDFIFYYFPNSNCENKIDTIINAQNRNIKYLKELMHLDTNLSYPKIKIFLFDNSEIKYNLTLEKSSAHSILDYWSAYYLYDNSTGAHEIIHLLTRKYWEKPKANKFDFILEEGFCFYGDEKYFFDTDLKTSAKKIFEKNPEITIQTIINEPDKLNWGDRAKISGAFVKCIVERYGMEKFISFWKTATNNESFVIVYGENLENLAIIFSEYLNN